MLPNHYMVIIPSRAWLQLSYGGQCEYIIQFTIAFLIARCNHIGNGSIRCARR